MSSTSESEKYKILGNDAYKAKNFTEAINHYTKAIEVGNGHENYLLYTNRALANFQLAQYEQSLSDADKAIADNSKFYKAHYWKAESLLALKKHQEANYFYRSWLASLDQEKNHEIIYATLLKLQKQWIHDDFAIIAKDIPGIKVEYQDFEKGKSVFATKEYDFGDVLFVETPIVSQRLIDSNPVKSCANCMRTFLGPKEAFLFDLKFVGDDYEYVKEPLSCDECGREQYCSQECRDTAWKSCHEILCQGKTGTCMDELNTLCKKVSRTNPLLIAKMFAHVAQESKKFDGDFFMFDKAFGPFARFTQNPESHEKDEECLDLIRKQIMSNYKIDIFAKFLNINLYRSFNGLILRNASTVTPISDFHVYLEQKKLDESDISLMYKLFVPSLRGIVTKLPDLLGCEFMNNLCITGSAPCTIHNSINHSCEPNVVGMSNKTDHRVSVVALRKIKVGDELFLSYIDESQDYATRQKILQERYLFSCQCPKCVAELNPNKLQ